VPDSRFKFDREWSFRLRTRSGDRENTQSPHTTYSQTGGGGRGISDFPTNFDKFSFRWKDQDHWFRLGRDGLNFWKQNELIWDDDVFVDGVSYQRKQKADNGNWVWNFGYYRLPRGENDDLSFSKRSELTSLQVVRNYKLDSERKWSAAFGLLKIDDNNELVNGVAVANAINSDLDYEIWNLSFQWKVNKSGKEPMKYGFDYYHNTTDYAATVSNGDKTDGWVLSAIRGKLKKRGDWLFGYYYANIEEKALNRFTAQDDWLRWGNATRTNSSNFKGHEFRIAYDLGKKRNLVFRTYFIEEVDTAAGNTQQDGNRMRLDYNVKF